MIHNKNLVLSKFIANNKYNKRQHKHKESDYNGGSSYVRSGVPAKKKGRFSVRF